MKFGYYGSEDIKKLLKPLLLILDCKHDKPFPPDTDKGGDIVSKLALHKFLCCTVHRFELNSEKVNCRFLIRQCMTNTVKRELLMAPM